MAEHQFHDDKARKNRHQQKEGMSPTVSQQVDTHDVTGIQRIVGNQGLQRILNQKESKKPATFIQAKLSVGPADDPYEREADQVADQVMTAPDVAQRAEEEEELQGKRDYLQRAEEEEELQGKRDYLQRAEEEEELQAKRDTLQRVEEEELLQGKRDYLQRQEEEELQAKRDTLQRVEEEELLQGKRDYLQRKEQGDEGFEVGGQIEDTIKGKKGDGQPLPSSEQSFFESRMGADFSSVKVHADSSSDQINRSISARAFTTGNDVFFKQGEYKPGTSEGRKLMAHELTHVIQQGAAPTKTQRKDDSE